MWTVNALPAALAVLCSLLSTLVLAEEATYSVTLDVRWSEPSHALEWPHNAHTSGMVGAVHTARYVMFGDGRTATTGLKLVAENGRSSVIEAELAEAQRRNRVGAVFTADGLATVPGAIRAEFSVTENFPLVSFVTMLAPSPDWFTGVAGVNLKTAGEWRERVVHTLWAWDAGTDSGQTYKSANDETQPQQSVRLVSSPHFLQTHSLVPVGEAVFVKRSSTGATTE